MSDHPYAIFKDAWNWLSGQDLEYGHYSLCTYIEEIHNDPATRGYHDFCHITEVAQYLDAQMFTSEDAKWPMIFAGFFHDIGLPSRPGAVELSASFAVSTLELMRLNDALPGAPVHDPNVVETIRAAIVATADHQSSDYDIQHLIDADLERFCRGDPQVWAEEIQYEYREHPADKFNAGRKAVLQKFRARTPFYYHHEGGLSDEVAYQNIDMQLNELDGA